MGLLERLRELEGLDPPGCELVDIRLLLADLPGCICEEDTEEGVLVCYHPAWGHPITFSVYKQHVPRRQLEYVIALVRAALTKDDDASRST